MQRLSARCAPRAAALAAGALLATLAPAASGADGAPDLRAQAATMRAAQERLQHSEHGALLALYAAETSLVRATTEQARLEDRRRSLAAQEASLRRRADAVQRSLAASQRRVAAALRELYIYGEADPIAAVLGATSLDEAVTAIESLERATEQNKRLAVEARDRGARVKGLLVELGVRRANLEMARRAAADATVRLAQTAGERRATVASISARSSRSAARIDELLARAREAEQASQALTARAAAAEPAPAAGAGSEETREEAAGTSAGTRTLDVDAVAYHLPGRTASGLPVGVGVVAVDPNVIPLGTRMFIPGYGPGIAADVGSAIRGAIIDLWMPSTAAALRWGRRTVTITLYL